MAPYRVLILSASFGEGHRQASRAIQEALFLRHPDAAVEIVDYVQSINRTWSRFAQFFYLQGIKRAPVLYGFFYKQFNRIPTDSTLSRSMSRIGHIIGGRKLKEYVDHFRPDVVIHTFPSSAGAHAELKRQGETAVPSFTVITDYAAHRQWIHQETDLFFVGAPKVRDELIAEGVPREKIRVTGIPVRQMFLRTYDRADLARRMGLRPDRPTVLLLAGAFGVSEQIVAVTRALLAEPVPLQLLVVTGRNRRLYETMAEVTAEAGGRLRVFGFVENIAELMAVSDLVFTKSGGLTTSEAVAMEVPMVFFKPIPGQEAANADFLAGAGVAVITRQLDDLIAFTRRFLDDAGLRAAMKARFLPLKRSMHETTIVEELEAFLAAAKGVRR
ncbi:UDP-N-acetylglucosamine 2-epimerase [Hydrogenibacillus sp. N12]|uniref:MGDG synthase family glycosyltransferase n=1 Tax=Hydrogenibacillus sp. N12 TaxID=2866627 RepID=UPI001C7D55A3|nr:UDP-N-acetylglucosamine 2-epimerase [Hydrogenibacillus sp. N12]QZA32506.1 UDP-N-acetylglucosamine 2-epimerase [Hydrogenibacillus sp. N12]